MVIFSWSRLSLTSSSFLAVALRDSSVFVGGSLVLRGLMGLHLSLQYVMGTDIF